MPDWRTVSCPSSRPKLRKQIKQAASRDAGAAMRVKYGIKEVLEVFTGNNTP
jgi:hypothetical protein